MPEGERRLAAIMFTDMVGYTALTQSNESQAMEVLGRHNRLLRPFFPKFRGREVKAIGDSFLVEFGSALDALKCAVEVQSYLHDYNVSSKDEWKIKLRIGVHLGDVIHKAGDVFGDAVNIASRIEPIAEPEGVCVSEQVFDQVRNKVSQLLVKLGQQDLKNVQFPIDVYKVVMPWEQPTSSTGMTPFSTNRIAILPFSNFSPDPSDEYFADGITDEIISTVSGISGLSVISRTSVMGYKGTTKKIEEIGRELKVGSILEGSFKKAGNRIRVTTQLIDVAGDRHLWAQSYDRELRDVFAVQSDIAHRVAKSMRVNLLKGERVKIEKVPTKNLSAYENYLRGIHLVHKGTTAFMVDSIKYLEDAVREDPEFSLAYAALGNVYVALAGETIPLRQAFQKAEPLITRALELDENSSDAHLAKGNLALQYHLDWRLAETEFKKAIALNPSNAFAHSWYSTMHIVTGNLEEALEEATKARELDPLSHWTQHQIVGCLFMKRAYAEAIALSEQTVRLEPDNAHYRLMQAYVYYLAGRPQDAQSEVEAVQHLTMTTFDKVLLARVYALLGKQDEARGLLREIEAKKQTQYYSLTQLAPVYLALGDKERALDMIEEEFNENPASFLFNSQDPDFDPLRKDPRFVSLRERLNLPKKS